MKTDAFLQLMRGGRSERVPFWEVWFAKPEMVRRRYGDPDKIEAHIRMAEDLGMAALGIGGVPLNCHFGQTRTTADGTSRYAGGSLTSLEQLRERELPDWSPTIEELVEKLHQVNAAGLAGVLYQPWCFHTIATSMGLENLAYRLYDDFDFLKACMHWVEDRNRKAVRKVVSIVKPDLVLFDGDCAYKTGLMVSPAHFRELVYDETKQTVALLQQLDIPYMFHTDGKVDDLLPMLIELGFAAFHGCEKQANDLDHLVDTFGDDICLIGNMDVVFLSQASLPEIRRETEDMIRRGSRKGRFIAACNTSPQDYIPDENYLAMCDVIKNF